MLVSKERTLKSARGNIYDRNGEVLATNKLAFSLTIEDNGSYQTSREKNLTINGAIYQIINVLKDNKDEIGYDLPIELDKNGEYQFTIEGTRLKRFRADVYGKAKVEDMEKEQANASALDIINYLAGEKKFGVQIEGEKAYTAEEYNKVLLPHELSKDMLLQIINIRYNLSLNSFKKYMPVTVATDVSDETVAYIMEHKSELQGVDIAEDSVRVYNDSEYFASIIGYTGKISAEEFNAQDKEEGKYSLSSVTGKSGMEQYMEEYLQGSNGEETIYVNNVGKILRTDEESRKEPVTGKDVYLTIDKDLQVAVYKILEQKIAGVLASNIISAKEFDKSNIKDTTNIKIPIDDVYYALIDNNIVNITDPDEKEIGPVYKELNSKYKSHKKTVLKEIRNTLMNENSAPYKDQSKEMKYYQSHIVNEILMKKTGILTPEPTDSVYTAWTTNESINLYTYLNYAITKSEWIDVSKLGGEQGYLSTDQVYKTLVDQIINELEADEEFGNLIYKFMLRDSIITGKDICLLLYEQKVLPKKDPDYKRLEDGSISSYSFMLNKINNLEITPAQLALDPCSGSAVIVSPDNGEVLACVSYPGYDNNRLANQMDTTYYNELLTDLSEPFYNKATQQKSAPGSTFKPIMAVAGQREGVVTPSTTVFCSGVFDKVSPPIRCWNRYGHGSLSLLGGIQNSCNVYFNEIAYRMGTKANGVYSETLGLEKVQEYAKLFDLDKKSGIQMEEALPEVTDRFAIPASIGQGTHNYTTSQLARYVGTIANKGNSYKLSILSKVTDPDGKVIKEFKPELESKVDVDPAIFNNIQAGMRRVVQNNATLKDLKVSVAGKTGTAQQAKTRPNHGLFIGFAPYEDPEIAMAIRITNGYTSGNAVGAAKDILNYQFNLAKKKDILTGKASQAASNGHAD